MLCHPLISIKWAICCVTMHSFSVIKVNFVKGKTMLRYVSQGVLSFEHTNLCHLVSSQF